MTTLNEKLKKATSLEDKLWAIHREFYAIPVRVSYGSWEGFEIRLTTEGESLCYGPMRWQVNVDDIELIDRLIEAFQHIDHTMLDVLNKVWGYEHLGMHLGFMEKSDIDEMLHRWKRFNNWVGKYYPDYQKEPLDRKFDWMKHKSLPDNSVAWAARVILYGIKPSAVGLKLFTEHKTEVSENGILTLKKDSGLETRWHFKSRDDRKEGDPSEIDSFGIFGSISMCFQKAFSDEKDIVECNKVPEQWEVDKNVFIGLKAVKKGLFKK